MTQLRKIARRRIQQKRTQRQWILAVMVAALVIVAGLILLGGAQSKPVALTPGGDEVAGVTMDGDPRKGSPVAPVTLVEYGDFQ